METPIPAAETLMENENPADFLSSSLTEEDNDICSSQTMYSSTSIDNPVPQTTSAEPEALGRGQRIKKPPTKLADYVTTLLHQPYPSPTPYPIGNYISSARFSNGYQTYLLAITSTREPLSYKEAAEDELWRDSVADEIFALEDRDTWTVVDLPPDKKALNCMWVFRLKFNAYGTIRRRNSCLVVCGNNQTEGIDYTETFAPVAKMVTVQTFLQQAVSLDW